MRPTYQVTELLGDGIGAELSRAVHTLADALPVRLEFLPVDLTVATRLARGAAVYDEAVAAVSVTHVALKYPTTVAGESPVAVLRRRLDLAVLHRPVATIPGVPTNFRRELDIDIVRLASSGAPDGGQSFGQNGSVSLRLAERRPVREAAWYAFDLARRTGKRLTSSSKSRVEKDPDRPSDTVAQEVAGQFPDVAHTVELFDAMVGKIVTAPEKYQVVLVLNESGDVLSDMACGLAGSLGIGTSAHLALDGSAVIRAALVEPTHSAAPDIAGKNVANPTAIFLALGLLLHQLGETGLGQAVKATTLDLLRQGVRTRDLGGGESTESFTAAVTAELSRRVAKATTPAGQPT